MTHLWGLAWGVPKSEFLADPITPTGVRRRWDFPPWITFTVVSSRSFMSSPFIKLLLYAMRQVASRKSGERDR